MGRRIVLTRKVNNRAAAALGVVSHDPRIGRAALGPQAHVPRTEAHGRELRGGVSWDRVGGGGSRALRGRGEEVVRESHDRARAVPARRGAAPPAVGVFAGRAER